MRKMGKHIPGLIVTLVVLITAIVFAVMLLNMKVIPTKFIAVLGLVTVSYTHLDVYKRQALEVIEFLIFYLSR